MMKKGLLLGLAGALLAGTFSIVLVNQSTNGFTLRDVFTNADLDVRTLTLNSANKYVSGTTNDIGDYVRIEYSEASVSESGHVVLGVDGTMEKADRLETGDKISKGLRTATVAFNGALKLLTNYDGDFASGETEQVILTSGETVYIHGNYWKLVALAETDIASVTLQFDCFSSDIKPAEFAAPSNYSAGANFSRFEVINDVLYYSFDLDYPGGLADISKYKLTFSDNADVDADIAPEFIKYKSSAKLAPYFNITDWYNDNTDAIDALTWSDFVPKFKYNSANFGAGDGLIYNENATQDVSVNLVAGADHNLQMKQYLNTWDGSGRNFVNFSLGKAFRELDHEGDGLWWADHDTKDEGFIKLSFKVHLDNQYQILEDGIEDVLKQVFAVDLFSKDGTSLVRPVSASKERADGDTNYRITLKFNLDELGRSVSYASSMNGNNCYFHLFAFGNTWNGSNGDFRSWVWGDSSKVYKYSTASSTDENPFYSSETHNYRIHQQWNILGLNITAK